MRSTARVLRCAACKRRIRTHEPDLILQDLSGGVSRRFFHTRCGSEAYAAAARRPGVFVLSVRHVEEALN